jgi:hypothetical protein
MGEVSKAVLQIPGIEFVGTTDGVIRELIASISIMPSNTKAERQRRDEVMIAAFLRLGEFITGLETQMNNMVLAHNEREVQLAAKVDRARMTGEQQDARLKKQNNDMRVACSAAQRGLQEVQNIFARMNKDLAGS